MVLHIQVIVMQQQKVPRNKVFIHWPTIILKSSLSVMGNTCLEIKLDMKRRQYGISVRVAEKSFADYTAALSSGNFQLYLAEVAITPNMDISSLVTEGV